MPHLKHATKKRFAKSTTRKKTIQSGISAEYTEYRNKLDSVTGTIKTLRKQVHTSRDTWSAVATLQKDFAQNLVAGLPSEGVVRTHAKEVETSARQLHLEVIQNDPSDVYQKVLSVLDAYLTLVQGVEKEYAQLEMTYTEVLRYQKKVEKLRKKRKEVSLKRNMDKLTTARGEHERCLRDVIKRQKGEYNKHEAVFQCAHHAFWIANDKYLKLVNDGTKSIRWESLAVRERLVGIDIANTEKLSPIPRVATLMPPEEVQIETNNAPAETLPTRKAIEAPPSKPAPHVVETPPQVVPMQQVVETVPSVETAVQGVPVQAMPTQTVPLQTIQTVEMDSPIYTRNAPTPIHVAHPTGAQVVHMVPTTTYTYQQQPVVHVTPEKPSIAVAISPDAFGPPVPTEIPMQPTAPQRSSKHVVTRVIA